MLEPDLDRQYRAKDRPYLDGIEWTAIKNMCDLAEGLPLIAQERSFARRRSDGKPCPECMDRLPFASEGVLSEVADIVSGLLIGARAVALARSTLRGDA